MTSRTERTSPPGAEILEVLDESRPDALRTRVSRVSHYCVLCVSLANVRLSLAY